MRLFIAINFDENMTDALIEMQDDLMRCGVKNIPMQSIESVSETMRVNGISLMKSEQGKHGMIYTEIGYVRAF